MQDINGLQEMGLVKGGSFENALVFEDGKLAGGQELRFHDECVRHKLLDMVGDLSLAGCELVGDFCAYRSGHRLNAEMVRTLMSNAGCLESRRRCA